MKVLIVDPGKTPYAKEITNTLEEMQKIVGGYIQAIYPFPEEIALICNEEGKLLGLPMNRALRDEAGKIYDVISGAFFLCAAPADSDNFTGLTEEQIEKYTRRFRQPEMFLNIHGCLACLSIEEPSQ